ncbi:MAG: hypothetical protein RLZZ403_135, partial [Pseudomonadota bacterium]
MKKKAPREKAGVRRKAAKSSEPAVQQAEKTTALLEIRKQIDSVDERIQSLLNERAGLAKKVGLSKNAEGKTVDFYRPEREAQVLRTVLERNKGPLRNEEVVRLFR